jgi:hypothetical protein
MDSPGVGQLGYGRVYWSILCVTALSLVAVSLSCVLQEVAPQFAAL